MIKARAAFLAAGSADKIDAKLRPLQGLVESITRILQAQALDLPFERLRVLQDTALRDYPEIYGTAVALLPAKRPAAWPDAVPCAYRQRAALGYQNLDEGDHRYLDEDWFALLRHLGRGIWSEHYWWSNGVKMVIYSMPIQVQVTTPTGPVFAGVVTCDIDLDWLDRTLADLPLGQGGYTLLMTHNGTYVSHPRKELALNSLREAGQCMVSGCPGLIAWVSWTTAEAAWLTWQPLKTTDWTVAVSGRGDPPAAPRTSSPTVALTSHLIGATRYGYLATRGG